MAEGAGPGVSGGREDDITSLPLVLLWSKDESVVPNSIIKLMCPIAFWSFFSRHRSGCG